MCGELLEPEASFVSFGRLYLLAALIPSAVGLGLDNDVSQIYRYISDNYRTGDELFLFGFSRGAFAVCSVPGL